MIMDDTRAHGCSDNSVIFSPLHRSRITREFISRAPSPPPSPSGGEGYNSSPPWLKPLLLVRGGDEREGDLCGFTNGRISIYYRSVHSRSGFTLLELLISLVMIGVIALIVTGALRLGLRTVSTGEKKIDQLEKTRASFSIIDSQIQSQIPLSYEENGEKKYYFQGDRESLQLTTNYSIWGGQKGYVLVRYKVESDSAGKQFLSVSEKIIGMNSIRESRLFSAIDAIHFEYYFKDPAEEKGRWVDAWTDIATIPGKVKLHLRYGEKDLSMIIPMRTAGALSQTTPSRAVDKQTKPAGTGK